MYQPRQVRNREDQERFLALTGLSTLTPEILARQRPDAQWLLADDGRTVARCSLWWTGTPPYEEHRLGLLGHLAVSEPAAFGPLLRLACEQLAKQGCTLAVGPLDGNTWQRYRLLSERGTEPLFFLEPDNPDDWPGHFSAHGFRPLSWYYSAVNTDLGQPQPGLAEAWQRLAEQGLRVRNLDLERFEDEMQALHAVSLDSFRDNFLFTPISRDDFLEQYRPLRRYVRPELVLLLEQQGRLIGYLFGVPDWLQAQRGVPVDTAIIKTLAVHPDHRGAGLGALLMGHFHDLSARLGYRRVIHALMHEDSHSRKISKHTAQRLRRYTLYAHPLLS